MDGGEDDDDFGEDMFGDEDLDLRARCVCVCEGGRGQW